MVTIDQIKQLREETGVSLAECKKALETSSGDIQQARSLLREWGKDLAGKKVGRQTSQGIIDSYIHPNKKIGVLLDLSCETDFVAKSDDFKYLAHELCLHVAAVGDETDLLDQPWIKDGSKKLKDLIEGYIAKLGENISVKRFVRYEI